MPRQNEQFLTQRAYTLRLDRAPGTCRSCGKEECACWREALWATHEAVNKGAKAFGDWLLTLRGGLCHTLAEQVPASGGKPPQPLTAEERRDRRILLALSWLSVEDERGAPTEFVVARASDRDRAELAQCALREILGRRGLGEPEIESWLQDCGASLGAAIRDDAAWVNRSAAFDGIKKGWPSLDRDGARAVLVGFFGDVAEYLGLPALDRAAQNDGPVASDLGRDDKFGKVARDWVSFNFGTGKKTDKALIANNLHTLSRMRLRSFVGRSGKELADAIASKLGVHSCPELRKTLKCIHRAVGWITGRPSTGQRAVERACHLPHLRASDLAQLEESLRREAGRQSKSAQRCVPMWVGDFQRSLGTLIGMKYLDGRNLTDEFSVMLDHAGRRVSIAHSWIKRAEARRRGFEADAKKLEDLRRRAPQAVDWLDRFCEERSASSGAGVGGGYRIRKRAIQGWERVVQAWADPGCRTEEERVAAAREVQADPEIEKFGDIQLFEALASDEATCVWKSHTGEPDSSILSDYVAARTAEYDQRRFKVPAYRHPDPLRHPVFCDFGESRWRIQFACHEAAGRSKTRKRPRKHDADWIKDRRGLRMGIWDGKTVKDMNLRWSSKRLTADLALGDQAGPNARQVTRADRLGRAASRATGAAIVRKVFEEKEWNGRLQAPREQLERIARLLESGKDERAKAVRHRLRWLVSFSPRLEPSGPFIEYAKRMGFKPSGKGEYYPNSRANKGRGTLAKLNLSRLPGIRVLSVDLGHRFAAACAVWETLGGDELKTEIQGLKVVAGGSADSDLYLHVERKGKDGKPRTVIYRRIGADTLPDGSRHPAPWARLDRQFLIKLQGESEPARKAAPAEVELVEGWERFVGRVRGQDDPLPRRVDLLMSQAVKTMRGGLRRHAERARIAFNLTAGERIRPGGVSKALDNAGRVELLTRTLVMWRTLFDGKVWTDGWAEEEWKRRGLPDVKASGEEEEYTAASAGRARRRALEESLRPYAERLAGEDLSAWSAAWAGRWREDDAKWSPILRALKRWIAPRGLRTLSTDDNTTRERKKRARAAARHVGGLSLTRIGTISGLYRLLKAHKMRPEPDDPHKHVPEKGDDQLENFHRRLLSTRDRIREQRVKQLASRIVEAALGVGRIKTGLGGRAPKRPYEPLDPPCHAVVVESLANYRPDDVRSRRENRQLMSWSAARVKKFLSEACELYGLHLWEVPASYTSRQCSRTGLPGIRCEDVPVQEFLRAPWWRRDVNRARKKIGNGAGEARHRFLVDLAGRLEELRATGSPLPSAVRIPRQGGALFVPAPPLDATRAGGAPPERRCTGRAIQADLNAAANIGLRALVDPDWPGRWWYVPCQAGTGEPLSDRIKGCASFDQGSLQIEGRGPPSEDGTAGPRRKGPGRKAEKEVEYLWRDPSASKLTADSPWKPTKAYWRGVEDRVVLVLRVCAGLSI